MSEETTKQLIARLSQLIAVDTRSSKDNSPVVILLQKWFQGYESFTQDWIRDDGVKGKNLIVKIPGENHESSLVFVCHMDTVPPSSAWETDPFILEEQGGKLYGLGTCDTKGGVASLIQALFTLAKGPSVDTYLVFDGDEEASSMGAKKFVKTMTLAHPTFIFIEPTNKELLIAQKSLLKFDIKTIGTSIHASQATPEKNKNHSAIYNMIEILHALNKDAGNIHPHATQNFGLITGGTAPNVMADTASATVDRRLVASLSMEEEFERIKKLILSVDPRAQITLDEMAPGFATSEDSPFVKNVLSHMKASIPSSKFGTFPAWSEAGLFAGKGEVVILGPGDLAVCAHRANEYVESKELFDYVKIYRDVIENNTL